MIKSNAQPWKSNWDQLVRFADSRLNEQPSAVYNLCIPGYYDNKWGHIYAKDILQRDTWSAFSAAAVYAINVALSGQTPSYDKYANQAIRILKDWAQKNKGFSCATGGLVSSLVMVGMIHAAEFIYDYPGWSSWDRQQFLNWAGNVLYKQADIKTRGLYSSNPYYSNWNDWGILAALQIDNLTENHSNFAKDIELLKQLIAVQIEPDGSMPHEIWRGSYGILYTAFALEPLTAAMKVASNAGGPDLFFWGPPGGGTVKQALIFLFDRGIKSPWLWPVRASANTAHAHELFAAMGRVYGVTEWKNWAKPYTPDLETGIGWPLPELLQPNSNY